MAGPGAPAPHADPRPLPGPRGREAVGLLRAIFADPIPVLDALRDGYGSVVGLGLGPVRMAVVGDPDALADLFARPNADYRWNHRFNVLGFVVGPGSLLVSDGADHERRRASVQQAFSRRTLNGWIPMMVAAADEAVDGLAVDLGDAERVVNLAPLTRDVVLRIAVRAFFGNRLAAHADEIGARFERPQAYLESPAIRQLPHPFPFTARSRVRQDRRALDALIDDEIARVRREPTVEDGDVLETLVRDRTLADAEIRDQVVTLIGAGYNTTAASLAWMLWCAVLTPGLWDRLRAEADAVLGPADTTADDARYDHTHLTRLELADRMMRETLRLHPAGVIAPREAATDLVVGGYRIPAGTMVLWSAHLAGRDPDRWPDPLRFDPDRWDGLDPGQRRLADAAWVPFGRGPRACIGFALAQMELTLLIARLAQRLDLRTDATEAPVPVGMVVNRPTGGVPLHVRVRPADRP